MTNTRSALITGGATGLGLGVASRLVADGTSVVLLGRTPARLDAGVSVLRATAAPGVTVEAVVGDVADESAVRVATERASSLGVLVACVAAAGTGSFGNLVDTSAEQWSTVMATNLTGAFFTLRESAKAMVAHGHGGSIVLISSIAGVRTHRLMGPYCVSKAGLDMLAMNAADELGASGVRVNTVRPGLVPTELSAGLANSEPITADYLEQMPMGRLGTVDDVSDLVTFLLSDRSTWITGQCISVDGGHHLRRGPDLTVAFGPTGQ